MIYTLIAEGFEEIEALAVVDILRRAEIDVNLVSVTDNKIVKGAHGISINTDVTINEITDYDMLFLPGGYPGYVNLEKSEKVIKLIKEAYAANKKIIAICAAPSILGKEGLLEGKKACCFPGFEKELMGAQVVFDDVCETENIITSRGAGTAHKLGFKIVELIKGSEFSKNLSETMLYTINEK